MPHKFHHYGIRDLAEFFFETFYNRLLILLYFINQIALRRAYFLILVLLYKLCSVVNILVFSVYIILKSYIEVSLETTYEFKNVSKQGFLFFIFSPILNVEGRRQGHHLFSYYWRLSSVIFLWVFGVYAPCLFTFIYSISISIICVSQEQLSLIASNQQIYDFYKWIL